MVIASVSCFRLLVQPIMRAFSFALESAGNNIPARIAMMAMTTSNSINVNALQCPH